MMVWAVTCAAALALSWRLVGLLGDGLTLWRAPPVTHSAAALDMAHPPAADAAAAPLKAPNSPLSNAEREAYRLQRYDKDNGVMCSRAEFLSNRRKSFERADRNRNGRLDFEEFAMATATKFARTDCNADRSLTAKEFAATAVDRKPKAAFVCPPRAKQ